MHGGNIGIAALVSLHDCPCEWRQRHMASGQCYLATLQMPLCCNVTPTWLITYHFPRPPPHFHISLFSPVPHFGSSPSSSLLSFPPPHILCFVPSFSLSCVISVIQNRNPILWGTLEATCREMNTKSASYKMRMEIYSTWIQQCGEYM